MNWRRGGMRLFTLASLVWLVFVGISENFAVTFSTIWRNYPPESVLEQERSSGVKMLLARDGAWQKCIAPVPKSPDGKMSASEYLACTFSPYDEPPITAEGVRPAWEQLFIDGFGPIIAAAVLVSSLLWVGRGFSRQP